MFAQNSKGGEILYKVNSQISHSLAINNVQSRELSDVGYHGNCLESFHSLQTADVLVLSGQIEPNITELAA